MAILIIECPLCHIGTALEGYTTEEHPIVSEWDQFETTYDPETDTYICPDCGQRTQMEII